jgi:hypothetical protein
MRIFRTIDEQPVSVLSTDAFDEGIHFSETAIAFKIPQDNMLICISFTRHILFILSKKENTPILIDAFLFNTHQVKDGFEIGDYNMDGYPDIQKLHKKTALKNQYWLFSPETQRYKSAKK